MKFLKKTSWMNTCNQSFLENVFKKLKNKNQNEKKNSFLLELLNQLRKEFFFKKNQNFYNSKRKNLFFTPKIKEKKILLKNLELDIIRNFFQKYGHQYAKIDPLGVEISKEKISKHYKEYLIKKYSDILNKNVLQDLKDFSFMEKIKKSFKEIKKIYCSSIGFEYSHVKNIKVESWMHSYLKTNPFYKSIEKVEKKSIFKKLLIAESFEQFLNRKFAGTKRFSLEGADVLIPMLNSAINYIGSYSSSKIVLGMAHRGRINVLVNVLNKPIIYVFDEFLKNLSINNKFSGDVKYHLGFQYKKITTTGNIIDLFLHCNPSHLEIVNSVVLGSSRSYIDNYKLKTKKGEERDVVPILIHGDAAICGQGVVQEILNLSQTTGYRVGGSIHIVINNQIGFTTSNKSDLMSGEYCTDIAKMVHAPVFHVNADDPESVVYTIKLAIDFRRRFNSDVFIDLVCYRRHGHNEVDDPFVTQPILYKKIKNHPTVCTLYAKTILKEGVMSHKEIEEFTGYYCNDLEKKFYNFVKSKSFIKNQIVKRKNYEEISVVLLQPLKELELKKIAEKSFFIPKTFNLHKLVSRIYSNRLKMAKAEINFDWGAAEVLAYATLIKSGFSFRLTGQDVSRGTFFHRHIEVYDQLSGDKYTPLKNLKGSNSTFSIINSVLSEEAVLGFEYGYSVNSKSTITIWEAQFGDFANGAQVVIDQFICAGEQKWNYYSNLIMFLPHGYEGQGPEHSSARIERYLQLCAQKNIRVCVPSTASQIYHLIRKQAFSKVKKPLVVITPKSLLRLASASSSFKDILYGSFKKVLLPKSSFCEFKIVKVIFCTGKIYFDLLKEKRKENIDNVNIIRIEQLYPFPEREIKNALQSYKHVRKFVWCQEEPKNQGSWFFIKEKILPILSIGSKLFCVSRTASAAPAVGDFLCHTQQQIKILKNAFDVN